jgi:hypothetical protein
MAGDELDRDRRARRQKQPDRAADDTPADRRDSPPPRDDLGRLIRHGDRWPIIGMTASVDRDARKPARRL